MIVWQKYMQDIWGIAALFCTDVLIPLILQTLGICKDLFDPFFSICASSVLFWKPAPHNLLDPDPDPEVIVVVLLQHRNYFVGNVCSEPPPPFFSWSTAGDGKSGACPLRISGGGTTSSCAKLFDFVLLQAVPRASDTWGNLAAVQDSSDNLELTRLTSLNLQACSNVRFLW